MRGAAHSRWFLAAGHPESEAAVVTGGDEPSSAKVAACVDRGAEAIGRWRAEDEVSLIADLPEPRCVVAAAGERSLVCRIVHAASRPCLRKGNFFRVQQRSAQTWTLTRRLDARLTLDTGRRMSEERLDIRTVTRAPVLESPVHTA